MPERRSLIAAGRRLGTQIEESLAAVGAQGALAARAAHCTAVAGLPVLVDRLVRLAVRADRQAGASWPQIGAALGISGEAARGRYARRAATPDGVPDEPIH